MDFMFVYDSSGSIGSENFKLMRSLGKSIIGRMYLADDGVKMGIVTFNDGDPKLRSALTKDGAALNNTMDTMGYSAGGTGIISGLRRAVVELAQNGRTDADKVIYLLTDGLANSRKYFQMIHHF